MHIKQNQKRIRKNILSTISEINKTNEKQQETTAKVREFQRSITREKMENLLESSLTGLRRVNGRPRVTVSVPKEK